MKFHHPPNKNSARGYLPRAEITGRSRATDFRSTERLHYLVLTVRLTAITLVAFRADAEASGVGATAASIPQAGSHPQAGSQPLSQQLSQHPR